MPQLSLLPIATHAEALLAEREDGGVGGTRRAPAAEVLALGPARARPALMRSFNIARSNSAKTPLIWSRARPGGVLLSTCCW